MNLKTFVQQFSEVASKYKWVLVPHPRYNSKKTLRTFVGEKEYCPVTILVKERTGDYFSPERFDLAASELFLRADLVSSVVDASDDFPDHNPKSYEKTLRRDLINACIEGFEKKPLKFSVAKR